jgi:Fe-S cluster assembly protein SufD
MTDIAFQEQLDSHYSSGICQDPLDKVRARAWGHFLELGLPSRNEEVYRYIKLRSLYEMSFVPSKPTLLTKEELPPIEGSYLLFVNGHFQPALSNLEKIPSRMVVSPLNHAMSTYGAFLNNQWARSIKEETDAFAVLNAALHRDGAFIYLPPNTILEEPIQIVNVVDTRGEPMMCHPRVHVFAGAGSQVDLIGLHYTLSGENYFVNMAIDCMIEENAHVRYVQHSTPGCKKSWLFDALRVAMKKNSTLKTVMETKGSATVRSDYRVALMGENCEAELNGIWQLDGNDEFHTNILIDHQAPHCRSMQLFKGVLRGTSRSSFEGKIFVRQQAQKTDAFQLNNNLLLSDRANADSKPNLEIFADDVKASHGATVGQLDPEHLFYMKSRGFSEETAKEILVEAFVREVSEKILWN